MPFQGRRLRQGGETYPVIQLVGKTLVGHFLCSSESKCEGMTPPPHAASFLWLPLLPELSPSPVRLRSIPAVVIAKVGKETELESAPHCLCAPQFP